MNNFDFKVFEAPINHNKINELCEKINENPDYQISEEEVSELVDCKFILDILKEHKIEYKVATDNGLFTHRSARGGITTYHSPVVCIFISKRDYALIKYLLEPSNNEKASEDDDDNDEYYDRATKNIYIASDIFFNLILLALSITFIAMGIRLYSDDKGCIVFSIIGIAILIFMISSIRKKRTKKRL